MISQGPGPSGPKACGAVWVWAAPPPVRHDRFVAPSGAAAPARPARSAAPTASRRRALRARHMRLRLPVAAWKRSSGSWTPPDGQTLTSLTLAKPPHPVFVKTSYCGLVEGCCGGAGIQISILQKGLWTKLFACSLYLGRCCEPLEAELQACGCALLSLHSFLASSSPMRY